MENDELFCLSEDWGEIKYHDEIVVYGTGRIGRRVLPALRKDFEIPFLVDQKDAGSQVLGVDVVDIENGLDIVKSAPKKIVVATMKGAYYEIAKNLTDRGLIENVDFCIFERFAEEWNLRWQNKCVLAKIDTIITSRCTLNCRNCNIFVSCTEQKADIPLEELRTNIDTFFKSVDFVYEYTLLGGEPFCHKQIAEILKYMGRTYGDRIGKINLISNGTVKPYKDTLEVMKEFGISVHISDYTGAVPYQEKLAETCRFYEENEIEHYVIQNNLWKDIVYPELTYTSENPREHMRVCGHSTHSVDDGKLYWCDVAYAAEKFMGFASKEDDYLDLKTNKESNTKYDASINIMKYFLGEVNGNGYMSLCEKCAGIGSDNNRLVKAGEQRS